MRLERVGCACVRGGGGGGRIPGGQLALQFLIVKKGPELYYHAFTKQFLSIHFYSRQVAENSNSPVLFCHNDVQPGSRDTALGPVVQSWISANPRFKFNPVF